MKIRMAMGGLVALAMGMVWGRAAEAETLMIGHAAPKLAVSKWAQGEPVKEFERDKAYIVEFWATWCGPCISSIPHVNELHTKFKDKGLVVIGQNVWENDTSKVEPFIKKMGEKMTYRVALDSTEGGSKGQMAETWMQAAGQNGIPAAFVVDKQGKIAWIGHPMSLKESFLEEVLSGKFDTAKAAASYEKKKKIEREQKPIWDAFTKHARAKEWDEADAALTKLEKMQPEVDGQLGLTRFQFLLDRKDYKAAYKHAARLSESKAAEDSMLLNEIAWRIATRKGIEERDLDLAERIARRANDRTEGKNPEILDTLARVLYMKGQKDTAIELQTKAVALLEGSRKRQFQATLDSYKKGEEPKGY